MILIINICKEEMHYYEFVRPIEDVLRNVEEPFTTKHYSKITKNDLDSCHRVIITGTSLKDMSYTRQLSKFKFLLSYDKPVLAICGGMQILCMINGCCLVKGQEIGLKTIIFNAEYLGAESTIGREREVYALHNMAIKDDAVLKKMFHVYSKTEIDSKAKIDSKNNSKIGCIQAVKHKYFKHYGILFHPEVRNKDMITNFLYV